MKTSCCQEKKYLLESGKTLCLNQDCENYLRECHGFKSRFPGYSVVLLVFTIVFMFPFDDFSFSGSLESDPKFRPIHHDMVLELNKETLRTEIDAQQILCPEQVYAQILIESGHLESFLVKRAHNLLGMRYPFKRKTTAIGIFLPESNLIIKGTQEELLKFRYQNHYAVYANWQSCVQDYKLWQDHCFKLTDRYLNFLGEFYAEDTRYVEKIRKLAQ